MNRTDFLENIIKRNIEAIFNIINDGNNTNVATFKASK